MIIKLVFRFIDSVKVDLLCVDVKIFNYTCKIKNCYFSRMNKIGQWHILAGERSITIFDN